MDISTFFSPVDLTEFPMISEGQGQLRLGNLIEIYSEAGSFPDFTVSNLAIIGVKEDRNAVNNEGCDLGPDSVRKYLYKLFPGPYPNKIVDLGNIRKGFSPSDTYFALSSTIAELINSNVLPIIIGGGQDLSFANYKAYESLGQIINIVAIDPMFDLGKTENELDSQSFLSSIILHQPNYLFNYANIGYQSYFIDQDALKLMKNLFFDTYRVGIVRESLEEVEPIVRNADMLSFDISAVRYSDAPGNGNAGPNGFYGEEACQIVRYAGISDKLTSIGFMRLTQNLTDRGRRPTWFRR